jgi:RNA polymerase sigma factor (sigma-70 family)
VQEVWARALAQFEKYDPASTPFRPWIFRIGKNVLLEALRHLRDPAPRAWTPGSTTKLSALGALPDEVTSFTTQLARDDAIQRFLEVAGALESADRELLVAHGLEGLDLRDVATRLALSNEAVKKRWQRLCTRLREQAVDTRFLVVE